MNYPQQYPPQYGPGSGMPPRPVSGTTHVFAGVAGVFFALSIVVYLVELVQHISSAPGGVVLTFLLFTVSALVAGGGTVMVMAKVRAGGYLVAAGAALFYVAWLVFVFSSGAPGAAIEGTFSQHGWNHGLAPALLLGIPAAVLALIPPTQNYIKQHHQLKSGPHSPPPQYGPPQYGPPQYGPPQYGPPPQGSPPQGSPPQGPPPPPYGPPPQGPPPRQW